MLTCRKKLAATANSGISTRLTIEDMTRFPNPICREKWAACGPKVNARQYEVGDSSPRTVCETFRQIAEFNRPANLYCTPTGWNNTVDIANSYLKLNSNFPGTMEEPRLRTGANDSCYFVNAFEPAHFYGYDGWTNALQVLKSARDWQELSWPNYLNFSSYYSVPTASLEPIAGIQSFELFDKYESLARLDFSVAQNIDGKMLARLFDARERLESIEYRIDSCLESFPEFWPTNEIWADRSKFRDFTTEEALDFFNRGIYLTPPTPRYSVLGHGRGLSEDFAGVGTALLHRGSLC
jgi:hypothetical protein